MTRSQRATRSQGTLATTDTAKVTTEAATKPKKSKGWVYFDAEGNEIDPPAKPKAAQKKTTTLASKTDRNQPPGHNTSTMASNRTSITTAEKPTTAAPPSFVVTQTMPSPASQKLLLPDSTRRVQHDRLDKDPVTVSGQQPPEDEVEQNSELFDKRKRKRTSSPHDNRPAVRPRVDSKQRVATLSAARRSELYVQAEQRSLDELARREAAALAPLQKSSRVVASDDSAQLAQAGAPRTPGVIALKASTCDAGSICDAGLTCDAGLEHHTQAEISRHSLSPVPASSIFDTGDKPRQSPAVYSAQPALSLSPNAPVRASQLAGSKADLTVSAHSDRPKSPVAVSSVLLQGMTTLRRSELQEVSEPAPTIRQGGHQAKAHDRTGKPDASITDNDDENESNSDDSGKEEDEDEDGEQDEDNDSTRRPNAGTQSPTAQKGRSSKGKNASTSKEFRKFEYFKLPKAGDDLQGALTNDAGDKESRAGGNNGFCYPSQRLCFTATDDGGEKIVRYKNSVPKDCKSVKVGLAAGVRSKRRHALWTSVVKSSQRIAEISHTLTVVMHLDLNRRKPEIDLWANPWALYYMQEQIDALAWSMHETGKIVRRENPSEQATSSVTTKMARDAQLDLEKTNLELEKKNRENLDLQAQLDALLAERGRGARD